LIEILGWVVREPNERNNKLMKYYPEKEFYIYEFDRLSKLGKLTKIRWNRESNTLTE